MKKAGKKFAVPTEAKNLSFMIFMVVICLGIWLFVRGDFLQTGITQTSSALTGFVFAFASSPQIVFVSLLIAAVVILWLFSKK